MKKKGRSQRRTKVKKMELARNKEKGQQKRKEQLKEEMTGRVKQPRNN